jgi:carboxypeptidase C (cathepsin A)
MAASNHRVLVVGVAAHVWCVQGLFDAQDGVAGTNAWIRRLHWGYLDEFEDAEGELWYANDAKVTVAAGWRRNVSTLTQVVVRNAGHMVPRDQPEAALAMMQQWVAGVLAEDLEPHRQGTQVLQQQQQKALWQQSRLAQLQRGVALARH